MDEKSVKLIQQPSLGDVLYAIQTNQQRTEKLFNEVGIALIALGQKIVSLTTPASRLVLTIGKPQPQPKK